MSLKGTDGILCPIHNKFFPSSVFTSVFKRQFGAG